MVAYIISCLPAQLTGSRIVQQDLNQHSILPTKCPVTATMYYIRNASFVNARIPSFLPATHFRLTIAYYVLAPSGVAQNALITRTVDFCYYVQHPNSDRMVYIVYSHLKQLGKFPSSCPVEPGRYYFRNLRTGNLKFPGFLPESDFMLHYYIREFRPKEIRVPGFLPESDFVVAEIYETPQQQLIADLRFHGKLVRVMDDAVVIVTRNSKIPRSCPIPAGIYYIREFIPKDIRVPGILPESDFVITENFKTQENELITESFLPETDFILEMVFLHVSRDEPLVESRSYGRLMSIFLNNAEIVSDQRYLNTSVRFSRYSVPPYFSFDMTFVVLQKLNDLTMQVRHIVPIAGINNTFYDVSFDFCAFLKRPTDRIIKMVFQDIKEHGPMPASCPIFPKRVVFSNISLDNIKLPLYLPETRFQLVMIVILTHADVQEDPKYVNTTVAIQSYAKVPYFSFDLTVVTLQKLTDLKLQALYSVRMGTADNVLYNRQIDFCAFLNQPTERILKMIYDDMKRNAKTPIPRCPLIIILSHMEIEEDSKYLNSTAVITHYSDAPYFVLNIGVRIFQSLNSLQTNFQFQVNFWEDSKRIFESRWYGQLKKIHASFSVINKKGRLQAPIYDSKADFCDFLRQPNKYHVMSLVYNEIRRFGRIPSRCPIRPSWYEFSNVSLRQIQLPSFLSETDFQTIIVGYIPGKEQFLRLQLKGALKKV
uniref:Uncharacterized protein n=1 Tax=Anopheles atroparvus TaxID=41427 RepID=A0A182J1I6_ANOAO